MVASLTAQSRLGEHLTYIANCWGGLQVFLSDGCVEMDSNPVENLIRPLALGRKNQLFAGHDEGAKAWACIASLIETGKLNALSMWGARCAYGSSGHGRLLCSVKIADLQAEISPSLPIQISRATSDAAGSDGPKLPRSGQHPYLTRANPPALKNNPDRQPIYRITNRGTRCRSPKPPWFAMPRLPA
jgi:hypothetical protein